MPKGIGYKSGKRKKPKAGVKKAVFTPAQKKKAKEFSEGFKASFGVKRKSKKKR